MIERNEVNAFADILGSLNDIEEGTNVAGPSQQQFDATKNLLHSLNDIGLSYGNLTTPENAVPDNIQSAQVNEGYQYDDWEAQEQLDSIYGQIPGENGIDYGYSAPKVTHVHNMNTQSSYVPTGSPSTNWSLVEGIVEGTKSTKIYSIKSNHSGQKIMDGIMMYEAAFALTKLLNEGKMITDTKILGIISSGLQYTSVVNEGIKAAKDRNKVLKESRYDDAKDLDIIIAEKKAEAYKLKERVLTFLKKEGYISK